jgi:hypothetical protein
VTKVIFNFIYLCFREEQMVKSKILVLGCLTAAICGTAALAEEDIVELRAAGGTFEPLQLAVPVGAPFKIKVTNGEKVPVEFESFELHRERVLQPGETITVNMPALSSGSYKFFDDFNDKTPQGEIVAK